MVHLRVSRAIKLYSFVLFTTSTNLPASGGYHSHPKIITLLSRPFAFSPVFLPYKHATAKYKKQSSLK